MLEQLYEQRLGRKRLFMELERENMMMKEEQLHLSSKNSL